MQGQVELSRICRLCRLDTVRELDVHHFVHLSVEEGCLDANMVILPPVGCCYGEQGA